MKIKENFEDLAEANEYIKQVNGAYTAEVAESKSANDKAKLLEKDLSKSQGDLKNANALIEAGKGNADKVEKLEKSLDEALSMVEDLGTKVSLLEKNRGDNSLIVIIDGKNYRLLGDRFITKKGELNADQLSKDSEELNRMIAIGSGSLIPVE